VCLPGTGTEAAADWENLRSPENYVGYSRTENLAGSGVRDRAHTYSAPLRLRVNEWAPAVHWILTQEAAVSQRAGSRIAYGFHARDLHVVMGPAMEGHPVKFRVALDGKPPGSS
jgi:hypothetical protein